MPTPAWKKAKYNKIWFPGETLSLALGQGNLQATPIQLLNLMAIIANEGKTVKPHLLKHSVNQRQKIPFTEEAQTVSSIPNEHFQVLKKAMWKVVNETGGTGANAAVANFDVCGKTGTAQLVTFQNDSDRKKTNLINAWFAGFAPRNKAEVAVIVLVEQAGAGGDQAAPIAKKLFEAYKARGRRLDPT